MKDLCSDVLIGHDILNRHSSVEIGFDGNRPPLTICSLAVAQVPPVSLFSNLNPNCRPLVTKSRRQTVEDNIGIGSSETSPGRSHRTNLDKIIEDEGLTLTNPFIDNVTVCGKDQKEHDENLEKFMTVAKKYNSTLNEDKCTYSSNSVHLLGYIIQDGIIKPDPERLKPLRDMPVPKDSSALQRALGMFAHYCQWIPGFSKKIRPLLGKKQFPLSRDAVLTFNSLKDDVANAALAIIEDDIPFRVETDFAIGATLSQAGRPVAFFSRTLHASELRHSSPEKEAYAIVESLRHLRHFLMGKHFDDDDGDC
ncbi:retrovirus-related Pol polyprotein from transposon opus [Trichonephila clavipes]|uniref:Retrovirus-related Pol polyprotein from transposon opus n=1 Tax=Trichonephila clavipes TaxID=2585209 RepID=A0A8X6VI66_TRICX|nr:retrovirus-related Pol polyprotein from transposon opus [Trichonephila clavipes]